MNKKILVGLAATVIVLGSAGAANASYLVNPDGTGFVGKGDVQQALGLSNAGIQKDGFVAEFTQKSVTEQSFAWDCVKYNYDKDGNITKVIRKDRANVTTTNTTGIVSSVARVKNQITGFTLMGFGPIKETASVVEGPAVFSCPDDNPNPAEPKFAIDAATKVTGEPTVTAVDGLFVNGVLIPVAVTVPAL